MKPNDITKIFSVEEIFEKAKESSIRTIAVANAGVLEVKLAKEAVKRSLAKFILIGNEKILLGELCKHDEVEGIQVVDARDDKDALEKTFEMVRSGDADIPMKGQVPTALFVSHLLMPVNGFRKSERISQVMVFDGLEGKLQFLTDGAINLKIDIDIKKSIIKNSVKLSESFGYLMPKVALLSAIEIVNPDMEDTVEASLLTEMNRNGEIKGCTIYGPLALDNAISKEAALTKGVVSDVAGQADILICPSLVTANVLGKSLIYYARRASASIITGVARPVIMTSRTDTLENRIHSIAAACYLHN